MCVVLSVCISSIVGVSNIISLCSINVCMYTCVVVVCNVIVCIIIIIGLCMLYYRFMYLLFCSWSVTCFHIFVLFLIFPFFHVCVIVLLLLYPFIIGNTDGSEVYFTECMEFCFHIVCHIFFSFLPLFIPLNFFPEYSDHTFAPLTVCSLLSRLPNILDRV